MGAVEPLPHFSIQQLAYLVAASDAPSWAAAADSLHVSPSALSQGVAELERRIGMDLFVREGRRRLPRPEARPVFEYARSVVVQTEDLVRWAQTRRSGRTGTLAVGLIDVAAVHHFADNLRRFRADRPDLAMELSVAPSAELCERVRNGELDLAVVVEPPGGIDNLDTEFLLVEPLAVYAPSGGSSDPARWGPWVLFPAASHTRRLVTGALAGLGATVEVAAESHQPEVLVQMVRLGMGWTVLPIAQAESGDRPLPRAGDEPLLERRLVVARRADRLDHPVADAFVEELLRATAS